MKKFLIAVSALALLGINTASAQEYGLGIDYGAPSTSNYSLGVDTTLPAPNFGSSEPSINLPALLPVIPVPPTFQPYVVPQPFGPAPSITGGFTSPSGNLQGTITLTNPSPTLGIQGVLPLNQSGTSIGGSVTVSPSGSSGSATFTTPIPGL